MTITINRPEVTVTVQRPSVNVTTSKNEPIVTVQRPVVNVTVDKQIKTVEIKRPTINISGTRFGGIAEAPKDGQPYERQDGTWILAGGVGGVSNLITVVTAETDLGGLRVIANGTQLGKVVYADNTNIDHKFNIVGLTQRAAVVDENFPAIISGYVQDPSWNWSKGPLYVGSNGLMTQTPPVSGFIQILGKAVASDKILINLKNSITLL